MHVNWGDIRQLGYLVEDVEGAVEHWMDALEVGPWTIIKNIPLACVYRGEPSQPVIHIALGYRGNMQIELIQQVNEAPSPYLSYVQAGQFGLHHTAYLSEDIRRDVEAARSLGHELVCDINMPTGGRYVYTQVPGLGRDVFVEFLESTERMQGMFQQGIQAAASWDGSRQVTVMDLAAMANG